MKNVKHLLKSYYWEKLTFSKVRFFNFKKCSSRSVFGELQLRQISLNFNTSGPILKIRGLGTNLFVAFISFQFERNNDVLKSESPCLLLNKNINFNIKETELKMENPTHSFREINLVFQLIYKWHIKSKTAMSWSLWKKREGIFCSVYFVKIKKQTFLTFVFYLHV